MKIKISIKTNLKLTFYIEIVLKILAPELRIYEAESELSIFGIIKFEYKVKMVYSKLNSTQNQSERAQRAGPGRAGPCAPLL